MAEEAKALAEKNDTRRIALERTLRALRNSSKALARLHDESALLREVCRIIVEDCGHALVWIGFAENDAEKSIRPVAYSGFEEGYLETLGLTWADTERGRGPTGRAIRTGEVCLCRNMQTDPAFAPWREAALRRGYASSIVFPLKANDETIGALSLYAREPDPFSEEEVELLTDLAGDLSFGLSTLHGRAERKQAQLERDLTIAFLRMVNLSKKNSAELLRISALFFKKHAGCDAVGIRLKQGDDYPYSQSLGFSEAFLETERTLCTCCEAEGEVSLACLCGKVISGSLKPADLAFTAHGSFCSNDTSTLLQIPFGLQDNIRGRCIQEGYGSLALLPLHDGPARLGLVQLNAWRKNAFTPDALSLWERLADHLAVAVAKLQAEEGLQRLMEDAVEARQLAEQSSAALNHRLGLERLVSTASTRLTNVTAQGADTTIREILAGLAHFTQTGRCYLFSVSEDLAVADNTHEWCAPGVRPLIDGFRNLQTCAFPWLLEHLRDGSPLLMSSLAEIPAEAEAERRLMLEGSVKAALLMPIRHAGLLAGLIGCDDLRAERAWSDDDASLLRIVGELLFDTLDRLKFDQALRASEELNRQTLQALPAHIAVIDRNGRVEAVNDAWAEFARGNDASDAASVQVGANYLEVCRRAAAADSADSAQALAGIEGVLAGESQQFTFEYPCHSPQETRWFLMTVTPLGGRGTNGAVISHFNITERKRTEDVLRFLGQCGSQKSCKGFFQDLACYLAQALAMDFVCIDRLEEGQLAAQTLAVFHDGRFEDNVRYTLKDTPCGEAIGQSVCVFPKNVRGLFAKDKVLKALQAESYLGATLWSAQGKPIGLIAVIGRQPLADTRMAESILQLVAVRAAGELERLQAERALTQLNAELEQRVQARTAELAATNRELEAFCYSVSHDLRAPLRSMDGFSQALLEDYGALLDAPGQVFLNRIRANCQRMARLIDDLLHLSRLSRAQMRLQTVDLTALALSVLSDLRQSEPERAVAVRIAPGLSATGDPVLLRTALSNLLQNAWKFTGQRPDAVIEMGTSVGSRQSAVGSQPNGAEQDTGPEAHSASCAQSPTTSPIFFVRDNGVGFDMRYADKLCTPFQRLHAMTEFPGSGIGLATVQRVIHRHGGRVWFESAPGQGATFYFTIGDNG